MGIFTGQIKHARKAYEWSENIPEKLRRYLYLRPKTTGITLVSLFDFAPMRGTDVNDNNIDSVINKFNENYDFLVSPNKDENDKIEILRELNFKSRSNKEEDYLEEDVQAFLIREIIDSDDVIKDIPKRISKKCGFSGLKYLTSEFEWSINGKKDRIDVLCCDKEDHSKLLVIELKKIRTTKLDQTRYVKVLNDNQDQIKKFVAALTNIAPKKSGIDVKIIYLMPSHPRLDEKKWGSIVKRERVDGIVFYNTGFSFDKEVFNR